MRAFTLVMAYYDNGAMLVEHVKTWRGLDPEIAKRLNVVIVDDCSPKVSAMQALEHAAIPDANGGALRLDHLGSLHVFRLGIDVPWNQDACRNIGVRHAPSDWVLLTDMDHVVPATTWRALMQGKLDSDSAYRFARVSAPNMTPYKYHPNTWAMTRAMFWQVGGYDEALAGNYGTDGDFLRRTMGQADVRDMKEHVIRFPREVIPDASTTTLERKRPDEKRAISTIIAARRTNPKWKPQHFRFPFSKVL